MSSRPHSATLVFGALVLIEQKLFPAQARRINQRDGFAVVLASERTPTARAQMRAIA